MLNLRYYKLIDRLLQYGLRQLAKENRPYQSEIYKQAIEAQKANLLESEFKDFVYIDVSDDLGDSFEIKMKTLEQVLKCLPWSYYNFETNTFTHDRNRNTSTKDIVKILDTLSNLLEEYNDMLI